MRAFSTYATTLAASLSVAAASQLQVATVEEYAKAMKTVAEAFGIIEQAVPSNVFLLNSVRGDALTELGTARRNLVALQAFFAAKKKDDAVALAADTLDRMDALREELAAASPNQAAAIEATEAVSRACTACHDVYREGDTRTGFRFKAGVL